MNIVIIGIGGIGTHLLYPLLQYLKTNTSFGQIKLIDGDKFENKNKDRQIVPDIGYNKADVTSKYYHDLGFETISYPEYVTSDNIQIMIHDGDIVFLCVDNNATRKLVDEYISTLENITLISGGNELYDGNVQIVQKHAGEYITPSLIEVHPEIANPVDKNPDDMSCQELAEDSQPQISIVNAGIADIMRRVFFGMYEDGINYNETYVNFKNGNIRSTKTNEKLKIGYY